VDVLPEKHLNTDDEEAPSLVIFLDTENNVICTYVIGDGKKTRTDIKCFRCCCSSYAVYYVFDLDYPEIYSQVLGMIQQWVIGDIYTQSKSSSWIQFSDLLSRNKN
jgi:hypothetical protein